MSDNPRELTRDECRRKVLGHLDVLVRYVENDGRTPDVEDKLRLLVFSMLGVFDGCSPGLPSFALIAFARL